MHSLGLQITSLQTMGFVWTGRAKDERRAGGWELGEALFHFRNDNRWLDFQRIREPEKHVQAWLFFACLKPSNMRP